MQVEKLRSLIRESINEYIREIDSAGTRAMYEAKMKACDDAMEARKKKIEMAESLEEMQGMFDENKINELKKEMKLLEKQKAKYDKMLKKMNKGKEVVTEEPTEEVPVDEADVAAEMNMSEETTEEALNESFLKMQKLAGVITETQYNQKKKLIENQLNEFGVDLDQFVFGDTPSDAPKASFEDKWNAVPNANKEVLKKSTGKEPVTIMASSKGSNYLVAKGSDDKFYLYIFTQAANPGEPKGPFNSEEDAKKGVK
jgi:hypothetical protein